MEILESTLTSKFQLTLPREIRVLFDLQVGDRVAFLVVNKEVMVVPKPDNFTKALSELAQGKSFPEIREDIKKARNEW